MTLDTPLVDYFKEYFSINCTLSKMDVNYRLLQ